MKIAAIVLNYNDYEGTVSALRRIDGFSCFDHIVAVDNASTDKSGDRIEEAIGKYGLRAELLRNDRNGGYGYGNNRGVRYAAEHFGAQLAVIANPDAEFSEEIVLKMAGVLEKEKDAKAVGAVMHSKNREEEPDGGNPGYEEYIHSGWKRRSPAEGMLNSGPVMRRLFRRRLNYPPEYYIGTAKQSDGSEAEYVQVYAVHGSFLMVDTEAFLETGGYDEKMFLYGEENVLAEKFFRNGYRSFLLKAGYRHGGSVSITGSGMGAVRRQKNRNASENYYYREYLHAGGAVLLMIRIFQAAVIAETAIAAVFRII